MRFPIQDIEFHFEDQLIEAAEALLDQGSIAGIKEVERNLWTAVVAERDFEPEVQLKGKNVVAYNCECQTYQSKGLCTHLLATFLLLRKKVQEKEAQKKIKQANNRPRRLTTNVVLNQVAPDELKTFVLDYARKNRQFSIALKARFAGIVSQMENEDKYEQVISTAIKSVSRQKRGITQQGVKQLITVVEEIEERANEAIEEKNYKEAFDILYILIRKARPILLDIEGDKSAYVALVAQHIRLLEQLIKKGPAPELEENIWGFLFHAFQENFLKKYRLDQHILQSVLRMAQRQSRREQLLQSIEELMQQAIPGSNPEPHLLIAKLELLEREGDTEALAAFTEKHFSHPEVLVKASQLAFNNRDFKKAKHLAELGLDRISDPHRLQLLEEMLLQVALENKHLLQIQKYAAKRFLDTFDFTYFRQLKLAGKKGWKRHKKQLIANIEQLPFSLERRNVIADIFVEEKDMEALMAYLEKTGSLDLLTLYDHLVREAYPVRIYALYEKLLVDYLSQHLGRQPSVKVKKILFHLMHSGAEKKARQLLKRFRKEYTDRHSLIEELAVF